MLHIAILEKQCYNSYIPKKEAVSMKDKELRKLIGSRIKQRRLELNLTQPYVAEKGAHNRNRGVDGKRRRDVAGEDDEGEIGRAHV